MTREETKRLKKEFENRFVGPGPYVEAQGEEVWQFIESEIITPYEKQLEQVERKLDHAYYKVEGDTSRVVVTELQDILKKRSK